MKFSPKRTVLILTWRDLINNSDFGGNEVYVDKLSNGLSKKYNVIVFSSKAKTQKSFEIVNNVTYIRRGSRFTVYAYAAAFYLFNLRKKVDYIIDIENGIPFFTPIFTKKPKIALVHHFHNGQWFTEFPFPVSVIGYYTERFIMPFVYKNTKFITVSNSSKLDLEYLGIPGDNINIGFNGVNVDSKLIKAKKLSKSPTILYLGRLREYKRIDLSIKAVSELKDKIPDIKLLIAGTGDDQQRLEKITSELKLKKHVKFLGHVTEEQKAKLLNEAWVFVNPSSKEGWGVVNIEANLFGTPVVGFNVYGVRDSVSNNNSGYLTENYKDFVKKLYSILSNRRKALSFETKCKKWANQYNWETTVDVFDKELQLIAKQGKFSTYSFIKPISIAKRFALAVTTKLLTIV